MLLSSSYLASSQETRTEHQAELAAILDSVPESEHVFLLQKDKLPSWAECEVLPECSREEKLEQDLRLFMKKWGGVPELLQATASSSKVNVPPMTDLQKEGLRRWEVLMSTGGEVRSGSVPVKEEEFLAAEGAQSSGAARPVEQPEDAAWRGLGEKDLLPVVFGEVTEPRRREEQRTLDAWVKPAVNESRP